MVGDWQIAGMVVQLRAQLQASLSYLTSFEKVLVDTVSFHEITITKRGAHIKDGSVEVIMRKTVETSSTTLWALSEYTK